MDKSRLNVQNLKEFLGTEVWGFLFKTAITGGCLFLVEFGFIYVLQGFLVAVGLMDTSKTFLPSFFPKDVSGAIFLLVAFGMVRSLVVFMNTYIVSTTNQAFVRHQRSMVLEYAILNSQETSMSEVMTLFNDRIAQAGQILRRTVEFTILFTSLVALTILGLNLAPRELFLASAILAVLVYPMKVMDRKIKEVGENLRVEWEHVSETLVVGIKNNFLLNIYGLREKEVARGQKNLRAFEKHYHVFQGITSIRLAFPIFAGVLAISAVLFVSLSSFHTPAMKLVSFVYIFIRIAQGASEAYSTFGEVILFRKSFWDLFDWSMRLREIKQHREKELSKNAFHLDRIALEIQNMSFGYLPGKKIFQGLNFSLPAGEIGLIRGESGAGKSTLIGLMVGMLKQDSGNILVNGQPVLDVRSSFYLSMGYVGPEPYMIRGTVLDNLLFGHPEPSQVQESDIHRALKMAEIDETISHLQNGLKTVLKETTQLSTGQKQRISIARALLRKPAILLMDEATANLDPETERKVIANLSTLKGQTTLLIISHKDSFNAIATRRLDL